MNLLCSVILIICINRVSTIFTYGNIFTIYGQIIYPGGSQISIEPDSRLVLQLEDISVTDDLATIITRKISRAVVFPVIFNISYASNKIKHNHLHVLIAKIVNRNDELSFINVKRIEVSLLGVGRTTFIDIPVDRVIHHDLKPPIKLREWPELVGMDGECAVEIIKRETGFDEVFVVREGTQVSKDLRYDRVCVYVDKADKVSHVPRPG